MFKPKRKSKRRRKSKMIDVPQTTRPRRLASERAKAYFLSDASISKQLEKEERDLRKALKVSRMEALKARRNGNESKSVKSSSSSSSSSTTSTSSSKSSSSSSSSPSSPLLSLPTTPKITTKATRTASSVNPKRKPIMGKPKPMEISAKNIKGCCKTMNQVKPVNDDQPKSKWIIRTRSQNTNDSTSQLVNYSLDSNCSEKEMFNCDNNKQPNHHQKFKSNGIDSIQLKNGSTRGTTSSSSSFMVPCATLTKDNGIIGLIPTSNGENCDKPRPKIMAQRKFASITYNCNTYLKSHEPDLSSPIKELFTKHKPSAEDFLTFLCFKSTDLLPPHLDFYSLNNITTSQDGSNLLSNDTPSNEKTADNLPINSNTISNSSSTSSSCSTTIKTNRNLTNGKVSRKRGMTYTVIRHPPDNRKKEPDLIVANERNNTLTNCKNGLKSSRNGSIHLNKSRTTQRTNKTVKVTTRPCKQSTTIKSTSTDENRPKKSSVAMLKRPKSTTSRHKSPTKVKISTHKERTNSKDDQKTINPPILNGKVSNKPQPKTTTTLSNVNSDNSNKRKVSKKVNCDRILRSTRSSSLTSSSNTVPCLIVETVSPPVANGKRIKTEKLDSPIMVNKPEKSAINGIPVDHSERKREFNETEIIVENGKKRRTTTVPSASESRRPKKVETIESLPSTSASIVTSISTNSRKGSNRSIPHRIETRSHTKGSKIEPN